MKANIIKFKKIKKEYNENLLDNKFKVVDLKCYFEKDYYNKIMEICHDENITLSDILNEALGMYMTLNYIDEDEHQKHLKEKWDNFSNQK